MNNMKDYEFINEQHERLYKKSKEARKRQKKIEKIKTVFYIFALIITIIVTFNIIKNDYNKAVDYCVSQGNSYEYCSLEASK